MKSASDYIQSLTYYKKVELAIVGMKLHNPPQDILKGVFRQLRRRDNLEGFYLQQIAEDENGAQVIFVHVPTNSYWSNKDLGHPQGEFRLAVCGEEINGFAILNSLDGIRIKDIVEYLGMKGIFEDCNGDLTKAKDFVWSKFKSNAARAKWYNKFKGLEIHLKSKNT